MTKGSLPSGAHAGTIRAARVLGARGRHASGLVLLKRAMAQHPDTALAVAGFDLGRGMGDHAFCALCLDHVVRANDARFAGWIFDASHEHETRQRILGAMHPQAHIPSPMPNRLAYVLHNSLPFSSGGYATRGHGLARGMVACGIDVQCITRAGYPMDLTGIAAADVPDRQIIDAIPYHRLKTPQRSAMPQWEYILAAATSLTGALRDLRPARVLAASNHVSGLAALIAARRCGLPFFYEVRGLWEITEASLDPRREGTGDFRHKRMMEMLVATMADHVFTLTEAMREELMRRGVPGERITLAPNACDTAQFAPPPRDAALAARYGLPPGVPVIGYIGSFVGYEGLEQLAKACALLRARGHDFRLLLVGNENPSGQGAGAITEAIRQIAQRGGIADRLILPGRVPHEAVMAHYSLIDIAPFPRLPLPVCEMISPLKPLEAMAMEKAVIVSSVRALAEMVTPGKTGLVFEAGDTGALASGLAELLQDAPLRRRLGTAARGWVSEGRSWKETAQRVVEGMSGA